MLIFVTYDLDSTDPAYDKAAADKAVIALRMSRSMDGKMLPATTIYRAAAPSDTPGSVYTAALKAFQERKQKLTRLLVVFAPGSSSFFGSNDAT